MKKGFTLIELLVVVLIIGILAAVALPQYEKAVRKSRIAEAKVVLRALITAEDFYFLANGSMSYWDSWDDLDIQVPTESKNWIFKQEECISGSNGKTGCGVYAQPKWESGYEISYWSANYDGGAEENPDMAGQFLCYGYDAGGEKICKSLGTKYIDGFEGYQIN